MNRFFVLVTAASLGLLGCPEQQVVVPPLVVVDAGAPSMSEDDAGVLDAGPVHSALVFEIWGTLLDGGLESLDSSGGDQVAEIDVLQSLNLKSVALRDYRLRVLDAADHVLASDDVATEVDGGLSYTTTFVKPLRPGRIYSLTIEGQIDAQFTDLHGTAWDDVRLVFKTRGQPEPERGKSVKKKAKKR